MIKDKKLLYYNSKKESFRQVNKIKGCMPVTR